jgi:DNA-binding MarR family transcriptional regulator
MVTPVDPPPPDLQAPVDAALRGSLTYLYSRIGFLLQRADQVATALFAAHARAGCATLPQVQLLLLADALGPSDQAQLARAAAFDTSTTALVVRNLLARGWISRAAHPEDRRRNLVSITVLGRELLTRGLKDYQATQADLAASAGDGGRRLVQLLAKLVGAPPQGDGPHAGLLASPSFLVRRGLQVSEAVLAHEAEALGLTLRQYAALTVISGRPGCSQTEVARLVGYELSNAGLVLQILRKKGLVAAASGDGRRRRYTLAAQGAEAIRCAAPLLIEAERRVLAPLTARERTALLRSLGRIICGAPAPLSTPLPAFAAIAARRGWPTVLEPRFASPWDPQTWLPLAEALDNPGKDGQGA